MTNHRIMVVDDDRDIRFVVSGLLGTEFEIVEADSGLDALEKVDRYEPDLVLLDIRMPIMDGFATCRSIRRESEFHDVPVFFLTGASSDESRRQAAQAGSQGYVEKPFDTTALLEEIHAFFRDKAITPRPKTFTPSQLRQIDATPLRSEDGDEPAPSAEAPQQPPPVAESPAPPSEKQVAHKGKRRRTFGAVRQRQDTPPEPPAETTGTRALSPGELEDKLRQAPPDKPAEREPAPEPGLPPRREAREEPPVQPPRTSGEIRKPRWNISRDEPEDSAPPRPTPPAAETPRPATPTPATPPTKHPEPAPAKPQPPKPGPERVRPFRPIPAAARKKAATPTTKPRVLCMVDERGDLSSFAEGLKGLGEFLPLEDPVEAVEIIARFQPDILFLRIQGAKYSGIQVAQLLQSNPRLSHTEVVFLTTGRETPIQNRTAERLTRNPFSPSPPPPEFVRRTVQQIQSRPGFAVRAKKLPYGQYVSEVLQKSRADAEAQRKLREREAYSRKSEELMGFMKRELQDYQVSDQEAEILRSQSQKTYYVR